MTATMHGPEQGVLTFTEPPFACFSPGPDAVCSECGCGFAPREWRPAMSGVVGLYPEGVA